MKSKQEERIDNDLEQMGITAYITHLKQDSGCIYSVVTVATPEYVLYRDLRSALLKIYLEGAIERKTGSALDALVVERFSEMGFGVAPCHAADNFSRKRGRIIAKGRLLKLLDQGVI